MKAKDLLYLVAKTLEGLDKANNPNELIEVHLSRRDWSAFAEDMKIKTPEIAINGVKIIMSWQVLDRTVRLMGKNKHNNIITSTTLEV